MSQRWHDKSSCEEAVSYVLVVAAFGSVVLFWIGLWTVSQWVWGWMIG